MASLSEVYDRKRGGSHVDSRRVFLGVSLFLLGTVMAVVALVMVSTEVLTVWGFDRYEIRRIAGVIGGLGIPSIFVGILTVLPASNRIRTAASLGAGIAVIGVVLFWFVYPDQWLGAGADRHYTLETSAIYFLGTLITFWCLFVAVANFKTRNDPGGTVELEVQTAGRTRIVEVDRTIRSGLGGIGFFGNGGGDEATSTTVSDGGSTTADLHSPMDAADDADILDEPEPETPSVDRYCGNCQHFEYVRGAGGMTPYCGHQGEAMEDMEPCEAWAPNDQ